MLPSTPHTLPPPTSPPPHNAHVQVEELTTVRGEGGIIEIGAAVTLTSLNQHLKAMLGQPGAQGLEGAQAVIDMLRWFAGQQVMLLTSPSVL